VADIFPATSESVDHISLQFGFDGSSFWRFPRAATTIRSTPFRKPSINDSAFRKGHPRVINCFKISMSEAITQAYAENMHWVALQQKVRPA
jgi:hypothetical protein